MSIATRRFSSAFTVASLLAWVGAPTAHAQSAAPQALETVTVSLGQGQLRSVQGISKAELDNAAPGTSPLATVARLPGVNFQAADALGNYEWSARFAVRAFAQSQLGFTLDDVPLGDMSYSNFNGLHISRAIASENVARAFLSQGTGALETASSSNLGGTLQFYSSNPKAQPGVQWQETRGSSQNQRHFLRIDSGTTEAGQIYLSYAEQRADKWKGAGLHKQDQWNLKWIKDLDQHQLSAFFNTSRRREVDYQDMSLEMLNRLGTGWDNFYPNFDAAVSASRQWCGNGDTAYTARCDDAYYAGAGLRDDRLGGISVRSTLTPNFSTKAVLYGHTHRGSGLWYTPYTPSPDGTPLSIRTTEYGIDRTGWIATLDFDHAPHALKLSYWREENHFDQARRFYATAPGRATDPTQFPSDPFLTQWQYAFRLRTDQFSIADTVTVSDALSVGAGFKSLQVGIDATLEVGSDRPSGSIQSQGNFLPQFGLIYKLTPSDEAFTTLARNQRAFQATATGTTPYATSAQGFASVRESLRPETSDSLEAGWRTQRPGWQASVALYHVLFRDRQLGVQAGSAIVGNPTILANVGNVRSTGAELAFSLRIRPQWTWYVSASHSAATYENDVVSGGVRVPTAGKHVVDAPDTLFKSNLSYEGAALFGSVELDHMSPRFYTYLNDASVPSRTLIHLNAGYRGRRAGPFSEWSVKLALTNLTDERYLATLGSNGFGNSDPTGTLQTLLPGAPRQWFVTLAVRL